MAGVSSRYRIVRRLGQGGMAEVFEGELVGELGFVRKVAIKHLLPDALRDPVAARRFVDESRIASQLHHASIVAVLDVGVLDDRPFQVLELVDGLDAFALARRAGGTLPVDIALMLAHAVAHALDHAHTATDADGHALGIVHRDVKPPNILVAWSGDVKLADFGIAVAHDRVAQTETGSVAGTRGFIAPEQRTRAQLDGRSDVFALGLTLHALCTGASPLSDVMAEARLLGGEPLALDPALPDDVRALIAPAVAPDRRDRPTAAALAGAIGAALAARGARDPRSAVRDFVSAFRTAPRRAGALDGLLGVELVPVDAGDGTVQRYATEALRGGGATATQALREDGARDGAALDGAALDGAARGGVARDGVAREGAAREGAAGEGAARDGAVRDGAVRDVVPRDGAAGEGAVSEPAVLPRAPARRGRAIVAVIGDSAVVAGAVAVVLLRTEPAPAASAPTGGGSGVAPATIAAPAPVALALDAGSSPVDAVVAALPDAGAMPLERPRPAPDRRKPSSRADAPPRHRDAPAAAPAPSGHGYVQVVGEELLRARVLIDGVAVGYVPNRFEVTLGRHRVEVERPDGVRLPPRELEVTSFHTAKSPARPSW